MATLAFATEQHPAPTPPERRAAVLQDPGFGRVFTDHMVAIRYREGKGWHDAKITARVAIPMDPAAAVLHYSQQIFEGLKAYRTADGGAVMFRPEANARRFQTSAERLAMPMLPEDAFVDGVRRAGQDRPRLDPRRATAACTCGPFMFASEVFLGVKPSSEYLFLVIASPVGSYFNRRREPVSVWVSQDYTRAGARRHRRGEVRRQLRRQPARRRPRPIEHGCDQVVFLDAVERRYVEELGGMNIFFVFDDGTDGDAAARPAPSWPGITRDSIIAAGPGRTGITVRATPIAFSRVARGRRERAAAARSSPAAPRR